MERYSGQSYSHLPVAGPGRDCPWNSHPPNSCRQEEVDVASLVSSEISLKSSNPFIFHLRQRRETTRNHTKEEGPEPSQLWESEMKSYGPIKQALSTSLHLRSDKLSSTSARIAVSDQPQMFHTLQCRQDIADYLRNKCESLLLLVILKDIWLILHITLI